MFAQSRDSLDAGVKRNVVQAWGDSSRESLEIHEQVEIPGCRIVNRLPDSPDR